VSSAGRGAWTTPGGNRHAGRHPGSTRKSDRADLESDGWYFGATPAAAIQVGDNLFVALGGASGGLLDIAEGYTLQQLPKTLAIPVCMGEAAGAESDCRMTFTAGKPAFVEALVYTRGGLRLVTHFSSKRVAYGLPMSADAAYSLDEARTAGGLAATENNSGPDRSHAYRAKFTRQFVSFAGPEPEAR